MNGLLIAFEGVDGSGKSTLLKAVADRLATRGVTALTTFEPGGSTLGRQLRPLILDGELDPRSQLLLFAADRAHHVRHVIRPALNAGAVVLCDRYEASSIAYQSHWLGLDEDQVRDISRFASDHLAADLNVWLDIDPELARSRRGGQHPDRLDRAASAAAETLAASFATQAAAEPQHWLRLDAAASVDQLAEQACHHITELFTQRQLPGTLLVVCGPSGAGKNTLVEQLVSDRDDTVFSVSVTTRPARPGEIDGVDYRFVNDDAFDRLLGGGGLLEWAEYAGHRYGTPAQPVLQELAGGRHVVAIVELSGAAQIRRSVPGAPIAFITADLAALEQRLTQRGSETAEQRQRRLRNAQSELYRGPSVADAIIDGGDAVAGAAQLGRLLGPAR